MKIYNTTLFIIRQFKRNFSALNSEESFISAAMLLIILNDMASDIFYCN
jgi:hypothetical protein